MQLVIQPSTNPLSLTAGITLDAKELQAASCRALDQSREAEMIADLVAISASPTVDPETNSLTFQLGEEELLAAFSDVGPGNSDKLWLLVVLFILHASPVIPESVRAKALIDLLGVVHASKAGQATALNMTATEEPRGTRR